MWSCPTETVVEIKDDGTKKEVERKIFPGYVLIKMVDERRQLVCGAQHPRLHRLCRSGDASLFP